MEYYSKEELKDYFLCGLSIIIIIFFIIAIIGLIYIDKKNDEKEKKEKKQIKIKYQLKEVKEQKHFFLELQEAKKKYLVIYDDNIFPDNDGKLSLVRKNGDIKEYELNTGNKKIIANTKIKTAVINAYISNSNIDNSKFIIRVPDSYEQGYLVKISHIEIKYIK